MQKASLTRKIFAGTGVANVPPGMESVSIVGDDSCGIRDFGRAYLGAEPRT